MRFLLLLLSVGLLWQCQAPPVLPTQSWEARGSNNRYANRFFLQADTGQLFFTDRRSAAYDLPVLFQYDGKHLSFTIDTAYQFIGRLDTDSTFTGILVANTDSFNVTFFPTSKQPFPGKPQEPRPPFPYVSKTVSFPSRDTSAYLAGTLTYPSNPGPFPAIVMVSGSGPQDRDGTILGHKPFLVQANYYTQRGIAVLRFDDRGVGKSSGSLKNATSANIALDVMGAVDFLLTQPMINAQSIIIIGHSEGGMIAPMVANAMPTIAGIVLLAGPAVRGDSLLLLQARLLREGMGFNAESNAINTTIQSALFTLVHQGQQAGWNDEQLAEEINAYFTNRPDTIRERWGLTQPVIDQLANETSQAWMRYFITYDPGDALRKVTVPVLALFGEKDLQVPPQQNLPAMRKHLGQAPTADTTFHNYPSLNHLFQRAEKGTITEYAELEETFNNQVMKDIADWILSKSNNK